ncbi:MAG: hypothetical protein M3019_00510, partial [Candidatus Dormibacteraeota bacterium]|nr:hypothetical protein [Candidatus Dormibacteraeota bacterium]
MARMDNPRLGLPPLPTRVPIPTAIPTSTAVMRTASVPYIRVRLIDVDVVEVVPEHGDADCGGQAEAESGDHDDVVHHVVLGRWHGQPHQGVRDRDQHGRLQRVGDPPHLLALGAAGASAMSSHMTRRQRADGNRPLGNNRRISTT